jgi:hypothetical protein
MHLVTRNSDRAQDVLKLFSVLGQVKCAPSSIKHIRIHTVYVPVVGEGQAFELPFIVYEPIFFLRWAEIKQQRDGSLRC